MSEITSGDEGNTGFGGTTSGAPLANDAGVYVVGMGRIVGTAGEQSIKIIVRPGTSEVITAFPVP
ncbi:MAG: hypothetical protein HY901_24970 [Deltaproteobacteria bacterium]|nr:hypothetical protein [Deltaproteobacteria bacterium]